MKIKDQEISNLKKKLEETTIEREKALNSSNNKEILSKIKVKLNKKMFL